MISQHRFSIKKRRLYIPYVARMMMVNIKICNIDNDDDDFIFCLVSSYFLSSLATNIWMRCWKQKKNQRSPDNIEPKKKNYFQKNLQSFNVVGSIRFDHKMRTWTLSIDNDYKDWWWWSTNTPLCVWCNNCATQVLLFFSSSSSPHPSLFFSKENIYRK